MSENTGNAAAQELKVPSVVDWPIFPFVGDMKVRPLEPVGEQEFPRKGDPGGEPCFCETGEVFAPTLWEGERWVVRPIRFGNKAAPFPAYMLETVDHLDMHDLTDEMGAEMGVLTLQLERALMSLGTVGRVHVNRWGDGAYHFHMWFLGRPKGAWQFSGYTLPLWGFTLPPLPKEVHAANDKAVGDFLTAANS